MNIKNENLFELKKCGRDGLPVRITDTPFVGDVHDPCPPFEDISMAKRFHSTDKYKTRFMRNLPPKYKLFWDYINLDCDHAGIWIVDFQVAELYTGDDLAVSDALSLFGNRIQEICDGEKWYITSFIGEQYKLPLNPSNKVHNSVLNILDSYGIKDLPRTYQGPSIGAKDKDKDMDKVKDTSYTLQQVMDEGFKSGIPDSECEMFYNHYQSQGWRKANGQPITDLSCQLVNWRNNGYKHDRPPQKPVFDARQQWERDMGVWVGSATKEALQAHSGFMELIKKPAFRDWAESKNPVVKEIA